MSKKLCTMEQLALEPSIGIQLDGTHYITVLHEGSVYAYINRCPHLRIPLEWEPNAFMDSDSGLIRCATHGALFLPSSGECVSGPCAGDALESVKTILKEGAVYLD